MPLISYSKSLLLCMIVVCAPALAHAQRTNSPSDGMNRGVLTITGKDTITATCLGLKVIEATFKSRSHGFYVIAVRAGSVAYLAGIQPGDLLFSFQKPNSGSSGKPLGADQNPLQKSRELLQAGCSADKPVSIIYNMIYKDPSGDGYLPFSGKMLLVTAGKNSRWLYEARNATQQGNMGQVVTQYDKEGVKGRTSQTVAARTYSGYTWPDRPQFAGLTDTLFIYRAMYDEDLEALMKKANEVPCVYNPKGESPHPLAGECDRLDLLYQLSACTTEKAGSNAITLAISKRCDNEWWNVRNNPVSEVVRDVLAFQEEKSAPHNDFWTGTVQLLFMQFERTYAKKCYTVHPEPLDTVKFTVSGSSRRVIYNRQGMPLLVDPGSSGSVYLFTVRKKYAQLYVDTYYNTNRLLMENDGTFVATKVFNYLSELFDRVGCDDKRVKLLEDQLYSTIITFDDENRGKYMREYKKYTQTGSPDQEVAVRNHRRSYGPPASYNWDVNSDFRETGIKVVAGDSLVLTATGKINFGRDKGFSGPRGIPEDFRFYNQVQGANFGALLLRTGYADWVVAGDGGSYIAPESGKLQFLVNDRVSADNSGSFKVTVKIYPRNDL